MLEEAQNHVAHAVSTPPHFHFGGDRRRDSPRPWIDPDQRPTDNRNDKSTGGAPRIYIPPQNGFESYLSAAIVKKHVPAVVTQNKEDAQFVLTSAVQAKEESAGSKVARCLFMYCAGAEGSQTASVQLVNAKTQEVAWAYNVRKASAQAYQSTAEAVAKHVKQFLEEHPQ